MRILRELSRRKLRTTLTIIGHDPAVAHADAGVVDWTYMFPVTEGEVVQPGGTTVTARAIPRITDLIVDRSGSVWYTIEGWPKVFVIGD